MDKKELPEAPVSVNTNLKSEAGFEYQLTLRGSSYTDLLKGLKDLEAQFGQYGLTPLPRYNKPGFPKKELDYVPDRKCPVCNSRLVRSQTKDGRKMIKCETNKWNALAKKAEGCAFIEWE